MELSQISEAVVKGKVNEIEELVNNALSNGDSPNNILKELIAGMDVVADLFERHEYYVPETLLSAYAMQKALDILKPLLVYDTVEAKGKVIIGTVQGDVHDIGKNLVAMFLEGAGFEVHNLGRDITAEVFLEKALELKPDIVAMSAMLSTTVIKMGEVIEEFEKVGVRKDYYFVIGGAAASDDFAKRIGADGYAKDATKAVRLCEALMKRKKNELPQKV